MDLDAIDAAFTGLRKLVDLGRFMERVRPAGSAPDGVAARELMEAGRGKARALVKQLQRAPAEYARWARQVGDEVAIAVSSTRDDDPIAACERAEAILAVVSAELERARGGDAT